MNTKIINSMGIPLLWHKGNFMYLCGLQTSRRLPRRYAPRNDVLPK